ncbi:MAG: C40 family peptidase [Saprospiraceae bacterium]|jgi:cell wall-associated NlpC family hydrolase|nr:C40 family peptidase [Saprospiraceae bacterium]
MTETIPSNQGAEPSLRPLLPFFFLILTAFAASSFKSVNRAPADRANDAEMMQFRSDITGYAQNFTGLRYRYAGRSPKTGFDCSGFTSFILDEFKVKVSACSRTQSTQGVKTSLDDVLPGDLVFFGGPGRIQHVALVVEKTAEGVFCVHSTCSRGIIVENISKSKYWKPKILFARDVISGQAI